MEPGSNPASQDNDYGPRAIGSARSTSPLGQWAGLLTAVLAGAALATTLTTPPRSGVYCPANCIMYPYTDVARYVPRDYLWMYPALLVPVAFIILAVCIHGVVPRTGRQLSLVGMCLATVAAAILVVGYGLQISVVQRSLLAGESSGLSLLSQYNPHGFFIGLENTGYGLLALAFVFLGLPLTQTVSGKTRTAGWTFAIGGALILLLLALFTAAYRDSIDVRFEVLALLLCYLILTAAGILMGIAFSPHKKARNIGGHRFRS